jgi:hypothetical protein
MRQRRYLCVITYLVVLALATLCVSIKEVMEAVKSDSIQQQHILMNYYSNATVNF